MERVTYIVGAGFSAPLGLPVMSNFVAKSKDLYFSSPEKYPVFKKVFDQIKELSYAKNYYSTDLLNIEEILSIQEMADFLEGRRLSNDFISYIVDTISTYTPDLLPRERAANWYSHVFGGSRDTEALGLFVASLLGITFESGEGTRIVDDTVNNTKYSVISLNYDMVFENYADFLSSTFESSQANNLSFETDSYDPEWRNCHLAKLHGSVHKGDIVPPTWAKGTHPSIVNTWKNAYQILKNSNHIRFVGYSLPVADSYLKYLLKSAVVDAPHLKSLDVICLDGYGDVRKRYESFFSLSSFRFKNASITDLAIAIAKGSFLATADIRGGVAHFRNAEKVYDEFMRSQGA